jgi:two-component system, cell cycle response regulator DivK
MAGEAILIVDDNPANTSLLSFILQKKGYQVRAAADAREALERLKEYQPRLIMMDIQLPGMDGLALTRMLKAEPHTREIVIIVLTAYAMKGDEERAREAGCDGYITKPIDTRTVAGLVAEHLQRGARTRS